MSQRVGMDAAARVGHTPGPWRYEGPDCFADYNILPPNDTTGALAGVVNNGRPADEVAANARLIAAAPELLEALAGMVDSFDMSGEMLLGYERAALDVARAALAKARGEA